MWGYARLWLQWPLEHPAIDVGAGPVKKGRHRRFEEARALKRTNDNLDALFGPEDAEPCVECGAIPGADHAGWCLVGKEEAESDQDGF